MVADYSNQSPLESGADLRSKPFIVPELCNVTSISLLVLFGELLVLVMMFAGGPLTWIRLALVSLFVQWVARGIVHNSKTAGALRVGAGSSIGVWFCYGDHVDGGCHFPPFALAKLLDHWRRLDCNNRPTRDLRDYYGSCVTLFPCPTANADAGAA